MKDMALKVENLCAGYGHEDVLHGVNFTLCAGETLGVVGPNGSGKSTLIRALTGLLPLHAGEVHLQGQNFHSLKAKERARLCAVQPQMEAPLFDYSVRDFVLLGRHPHRVFLDVASEADHEAVHRALHRAGVDHLVERSIRTLSTGEWQRILLARTLAQETPMLFLDEPAAHLDPGHRHAVHVLLRHLAHKENRAVLCISHDLNLAAEFCDRLLLLREGTILALGTPTEVLQEGILQELFCCAALRVILNPHTGRPGTVFAS